MSIENPSLLYVEQSLTSTQKARALANIGAQAAEVGKGLSTNDFDNAALGTLQSLTQKVQGIESGAEVNVIDEITVNGTAVTPTGKTVALTIPSEITVDQTYNGSSTNPQSGIAVAQALSGTGQVPTVTSNDDGKVLKASYDSGTSQGSFRWDSAPSGVPSTTSADEGKVLGVTNSTGTLGWVSHTPAAHDSTVTVKTGDSTPVTIGSFTTDQASNSDITIPLAVPTGTGEKSGLMSASDKAKLNGLGNVVVAGSGSITVTPTTSAGTTTYTVSANSTDIYVDDTLSKTVDTPNAGDITLGVNTKSSNSYLDKTNGLGVDISALKTGIGTGNNGLVPSAGSSGQFLKHDGSWGTPPDTTYSTFSTSDNGLVPKPTSQEVSDDKYLKSDGSWGVPTGTTYSTFDTTTDGLVPKANSTGDTGKFLKGDGSWDTPTDTTYNVFTTSADGLVPASDETGETDKFLKGDGTWDTPTDTTYSTFNTTTDGLVPKANGNGDTGKFLKGDGTWATPTDTTYSGGDGIDITSNTVTVDLADKSGLEISSGKLQVKCGANLSIDQTSGALVAAGGGGGTLTGVKLEGASSALTPVSGEVTIPNASAVSGSETNGLLTSNDKAKLNSYPSMPGSSASKFLKDDGTWDIPAGTTYSGGDGIDITGNTVKVDLVASGSGLEFSSSKLKVNGNASHAIEVGTSGVGIKLATGSGLEFSSGLKVKTDGTTIHANASGELEVIGGGGGTTYTAGDGIDISAQNVISAKVDGTSITVNASHELTTSAEANVIEGVKLDGAASVLTPDASKNVTIPNAVAAGETGATNGLMTADDKKALGTAVQYKVNPQESGTHVLLAQQIYVVDSDAQIVAIATNPSEINGKGTLFFRIGTAVT